jgi:hypothetical protein
MKHLLLILICLWSVTTMIAQDVPEGFEPFEARQYGMTGLIPAGWTVGGFGIWARGEQAADITQSRVRHLAAKICSKLCCHV